MLLLDPTERKTTFLVVNSQLKAAQGIAALWDSTSNFSLGMNYIHPFSYTAGSIAIQQLTAHLSGILIQEAAS